jgi:hypothetical protein
MHAAVQIDFKADRKEPAWLEQLVRSSFMLNMLQVCLPAVFLAAVAVASRLAAPQPATEVPALRDGNALTLPADFREWVFLSAGLGMTYGPNAPAAGQPPSFTNVYVNPASYRAFLKSGAWPDRTMFILEVRESASERSINRLGRFQTALRAVEVNLKDARLPGGWGFFDFGSSAGPVAPLPQTASCYACHRDNTAVEHTFVQFYPTLMDVARRRGTVKATYRETPDPPPADAR